MMKKKIEAGYFGMRISVSKSIAIAILACMNIINFLGVELCGFNVIVLNLFQMELLVVYIFALCASIKRYGICSIKTCFLLALALFSLNAVFLTVFGLMNFGDTVIGIRLFTWKMETQVVIIGYYILFLSVFYFIALSDKAEIDGNKTLSRWHPNDKNLLLWARRGFYFTYPFAILYSVKYVLIARSIGYLASLKGNAILVGPVNLVLKILYNIFILSFYLICSSEEDGKKFDKCGVMYTSCMVLYLMQGSRSVAMIPLFFVLIFRREVYRKEFNAVVFGIIVVLLIVVMQAITVIRRGEVFAYSGLLDTMSDFLKETSSGSINVAGYYYQYRDLLNVNNMPYISDSLVRLIQLILYPDKMEKGNNLDMVKMRPSLNHQLTYSLSEEYYLSGAGVGGNFIAEMSEFYLLGVLIGSIVFSLWIVFVSRKIKTSRFIRYFSSLLIAHILLAPRSEVMFDLYTFVKWTFFYVAAVWLFAGKISLKRGIHKVMRTRNHGGAH